MPLNFVDNYEITRHTNERVCYKFSSSSLDILPKDVIGPISTRLAEAVILPRAIHLLLDLQVAK
ncbi:hypothetical protein ISN44_As05g035880 [Arabidopsis suecica]|uniref:Uncharacterized protein n=1 Tax=Arabidopsis suecica TaxID=45249 RepID=A0A8T2DM58_ARASU|nr:hypothetical protein ISN44_As05g035880 [Arabidopsis suecica]